MAVVRRIQQMPADGQVLIQKVRIKNIIRVSLPIKNSDVHVPAHDDLKGTTADITRAGYINLKILEKTTKREGGR
jgi:hypothetical protein